MPKGSPLASVARLLNGLRTEFICGWRARRTLRTTSVSWTIPSCRGHFIRRITLTLSPFGMSWKAGFPSISSLASRCAANPAKEVRHIGLQGEELAAFLNTLRALNDRQFRAVEKALHMMMPSIHGIHVEVNSLGEVELRLREGNTLIPARVVSEGTLRILGLLALAGATEPPALIGLEEPENGVHPRRLQLIAELLQTRAELGETQMIVTTHSPLSG